MMTDSSYTDRPAVEPIHPATARAIIIDVADADIPRRRASTRTGRPSRCSRRRRRVVWEAVELAEGEVPEPRCVVGLCGVFGWVVDRLVD